MKILTIVGTRPQFIKAVMASSAIAEHKRQDVNQRAVEEILNTIQH